MPDRRGVDDSTLIARFLATRRPGTARVYRPPLVAWQAACPAGLAAATPADAQRFAVAVLAPKAPLTRERWIYVLRSFYRWAQAHGGFARNPWLAVAPPARRVRRPQPHLDPATVQQLLAAAADDARAAALVLLCLTTGLGLGELAGARWGDIARSADGALVLHVRGRTDRYLKLLPETWAALQRYRTAVGRSTALDPTCADPLIGGRHGERVSPEALTKVIAKTAARAGCTTLSGRRITAQTLRQAHAVLAFQGGATPPQIQAALGLRHRDRVDQLLATVPAVGDTSADAVARMIWRS